jgi:UDP-2-acetamido-3-amino-2,3-dideoxy-glucuronate N-acetyltransferase
MGDEYFKHETAFVEDGAQIGEGTKVWHGAQVRKGARVGKNCVLGKNVFVGEGAVIGDNCKIQNNVNVFKGVTLEDNVFLGPNSTTTNDLRPRAFNNDFEVIPTLIKKGASVGAGAVMVCGVTLGERCMVAAGAVVTKDVPAFSLVAGNPAKKIGVVDEEGNRK